MSRPPRVILLTGAPPASALDAASCTVDDFEAPFGALLGLGPGPRAPPPSAHVAWRSLPLTRRPLDAGLGHGHGVDDAPLPASAHFFTTADVSAAGGASGTSAGDGVDAAWTQFCEQSLAEHHAVMPPSQPDDSLDAEETSFVTTSSASRADAPRAMLAPPVPLHLSDLDDVPPANRIVALQPQTVTLNLIVGVVGVEQPRTVTTRWGHALSLVEVLVGDDTAAGFAVTFWLSRDSAAESSIVKLRRQDVVLMENVALHVFRGKVYGQSLRKSLTRVHLLWRRDGSGHYSTRSLDRRQPARHPQQDKTRLVKDWVLNFVGRDAASTTADAGCCWDRPPDDTQ